MSRSEPMSRSRVTTLDSVLSVEHATLGVLRCSTLDLPLSKALGSTDFTLHEVTPSEDQVPSPDLSVPLHWRRMLCGLLVGNFLLFFFGIASTAIARPFLYNQIMCSESKY
jgi:hypothetical protein